MVMHCAKRATCFLTDFLMKAFSPAVSLAEYEAAEAKPIKMPCTFCKAEEHAHENFDVPEEGATSYSSTTSISRASPRWRVDSKDISRVLYTTNADESTLAKLKNLRDDDFRDK